MVTNFLALRHEVYLSPDWSLEDMLEEEKVAVLTQRVGGADWSGTAPRTVGVVGSRGYTPLRHVRDYINLLPETWQVVTGCARQGVDRVVRSACKKRYRDGTLPEVIVHRAQWNRYGRSAGPRRNQLIVDDVDLLVSFWDGTSPGSRDTLQKARVSNTAIVLYSQGSLGDV